MSRTRPSSPSDAALDRILASIRKLGLERSLVELETQGYTALAGVLSPEKVSRARDAIVARVERTTGRKVDITSETGEGSAG